MIGIGEGGAAWGHDARASAVPAATGPQPVIVRPGRDTLSRQRLPYFLGISRASAGATAISMNLVVIPAGGRAQPHRHRGYETAVYLLRGRVEVRHGPTLGQSVILETGDFLFIPADLPHQPVNLSTTQTALAVVARNDPNEQESVEVFGEDAPAAPPCRQGT